MGLDVYNLGGDNINNQVFIPFIVDSLGIRRTDNRTIPNNNQNYIYALFNFNSTWDGLNKIAIFSRKNEEPIHSPIVDDVCQFPNDLLRDIGIIDVSVYAGDRRTVNTATVEISESGFIEGVPVMPPEPAYVYVQSPDSTIPFIRYYDGEFEFFADGEWHIVADYEIDESIFEQIDALENSLSTLRASVTGLQNEATAKWQILNTVEVRSRNNATNITSILARIDALEGRA